LLRGYSLVSECEISRIEVFYDISTSQELFDVSIRFYSCQGDYFDLDSPQRLECNDEKELFENFEKILNSLLNRKPSFDEVYRLKFPSEMTQWSEATIKSYLDNNRITELEGIYEAVRTPSDDVIQSKYKIGIMKNTANGFDIVYLSGANNYKDWQEGEKKGEINLTAKPNLYTTKWKMSNKSENTDVYCSIDENGFLKFIFSQNNQLLKETNESFFLKLYPIGDNISSDNKKGTATAFTISQDGYLVTSQHVVAGSSSFKVIINNNTEQTSYDVTLVLEDKNNDIAVLKINDPKFQKLNPIPFTIKSASAEVGEDVYVLGYPLSTTMGNELKATDGIISSKTGFQGDLTSYQVSAPVQPGNSGGPLFDKKGNLIGIISAKHLEAENVSYAVKSSYLINVINALENLPSLPTKNLLSGKNLADQIKLVRDFIFMIEVY
jgi:S1-C subfamily serine protease